VCRGLSGLLLALTQEPLHRIVPRPPFRTDLARWSTTESENTDPRQSHRSGASSTFNATRRVHSCHLSTSWAAYRRNAQDSRCNRSSSKPMQVRCRYCDTAPRRGRQAITREQGPPSVWIETRRLTFRFKARATCVVSSASQGQAKLASSFSLWKLPVTPPDY
jgi:hypothetical protein